MKKNSDFFDLESVTIEFDDRQTHEVYFESHFFFAHIETGTSMLVQFIPMSEDVKTFPTFIDGGRVRIDGEIFIVLDKKWGTLPIFEYGHEPPFDPIMMGVYVHRMHSLSDVVDPFPETLWRDVPGMAHKFPDDDPQLRQVAHARTIGKMLATKVKNINALMKEGLSESDLADDIKEAQKLIDYNLRVRLKNVTREYIRGA
jgi:hypothetical protein